MGAIDAMTIIEVYRLAADSHAGSSLDRAPTARMLALPRRSTTSMNIVSKQELIEFPEDQAKAAEAAQSPQTLGEQPISGEVLLEKYAKGDESSAREVHARVAHALAQCEAEDQRALWQERFTHALEAGFVPAGRINSAAGTALAATLINGFVQPVGDSITEMVDDRPGIYTALAEAAAALTHDPANAEAAEDEEAGLEEEEDEV
jgi:hypothetical protein